MATRIVSKRPKRVVRFDKNRVKESLSTSVTKTQVRNMIASVINTGDELKYIDMPNVAATGVSSTMNAVHMTGITQGTSVNNRIGNEIRIEKVDILITWIAGDATNFGRILVVKDMQPNKAAFAQTDLFVNGSDAQSWFNEDNKHRFKIFLDWTCDIGTAGPGSQTCKMSVPLKGVTYYTGASNSIANVTSDAFFIVYISDSGAVPNPTITGNVRLWFREFEARR